MASNIEKLIEDMENYIDTQSKPAAFSSSKIVINRDELEQYLQELKETPLVCSPRNTPIKPSS